MQRAKRNSKEHEDRSAGVRLGCFDRSLWLGREGSWEAGERPAGWSCLCWEGLVLMPASHTAPPFLSTSLCPSPLHPNRLPLSPTGRMRVLGWGQVLRVGRSRVSTLEGLGTSQAGPGMSAETEPRPRGWASRAGGTSLFSSQVLASALRGIAGRLPCGKPSNLSQ